VLLPPLRKRLAKHACARGPLHEAEPARPWVTRTLHKAVAPVLCH
jgi:hypothetical protein